MKLNCFLGKVMLFSLITSLLFFQPNKGYAQLVAKSGSGTPITNCGGYYEYIPSSYGNSNTAFPLIVFIHGIGELGNGTTDLPSVLKNGLPRVINEKRFPESFNVNGKSFSFIVVAPQFKTTPSPVDIRNLINYIKTQYRIDENRLYVTGLSMGGGVAENFASANDDFAKLAAAVVAVSGNMDPNKYTNAPIVAARNNVPLWFLHNDGDSTVPSAFSKTWVAKMSAYQPTPKPLPKLTIFPVSGHDAWTKAYDPQYKENNMNVYEWMLQYSKGETTTTPPPVPAGGKRVQATPNIGNGILYTDAMTAFGLQPGDTLCIPAGDYEFIQLTNIVGTKEKPIVITNCGGQVRVGINTHKTNIALGLMSAKFVEISGSGTPGLEYGFDINGRNLDGVQMQGVYLGKGSTDFDLHNVYIHDADILLVAKTTQACDNPEYWEGNYVMRNAKIHHIKGRNATHEGFYIGNSHYILNFPDCAGDIKSHHIENLEVYDNDLQDLGWDGIQICMADVGDNKVYNNVVRNYGTLKLDAQSYGMLMGGGSAVKVYNNVVDNGYLPGIALFGSGVSYVYNNIISNVSNGEGINVADKFIIEPVTAYIYNNTIYNTGPTGIKIYAYLTQLGHKVYNNLVINKGSSGDYPQTGYYIRGAQDIKFDFSNNFFSDTPEKAKVVNAAGGNFRLMAGAEAIDAGRDMTDLGLNTDAGGTSRPQNGKFDGGAYEFVAGTTQKMPQAVVGKDITITLPASSVTLDGTASTSPNGNISSWNWTKSGGPAQGTITNATSNKTTVTNLAEGTYVFVLTVTDNLNLKDTAHLTVTVKPAVNQAPVADAGNDTSIVLPENSITLSGTASTDKDGSIVAWAWTKLQGPAAGTIVSPAAGTTSVTGLVEGTYIFELTVTDDKGGTAKTSVTVIVNPAGNIPPVANAGSNITITLPESSVLLDGSASSDEDGKIVSYLWQKISGPNVVFSNANAAKNTVTKLVEATYVFQLTVTDDKGASSTARMTVVVNPVINVPPVANAGSDITIRLPISSVMLDGSNSSDGDGNIASYLWQKISGPNVVFSDPAASKNTVTGMAEGTYVFELIVTDNKGATATSRVNVTVLPAENIPPVARVTADETLQLPDSFINASASESEDPDGSITKYLWEQLSGPTTANVVTPNGSKTLINKLEMPGAYLFRLTITDNNGATAEITFSVHVLPENPDGHVLDSVSMTPNPVASTGNLKIFMQGPSTAWVNIYDINGHLVFNKQYFFENSLQTTLDLSKLVPGMYFLQVRSDEKRNFKRVQKFVKTNY